MTENAHAPPLPTGTRIHELIIQKPLGRGGSGIVYAAHHEILDQLLAVKEFLPGTLARRVEDLRVEPLPGQESIFTALKQKFLEEGKTLVELALPRAHPTIVRATDAFRANDTVYLCMCFEQGQSLDAAVKAEGPFAEARVRALLVPLLDGLARVHALGVLHRDIKPSNILIRDDGSPVLIDFGAAHRARQDAPESVVAQYTPHYAAPEQVMGGMQGPWTDLYCLAATCVYALTGRLPKGESTDLEPIGALARVDVSLLEALSVALQLDWTKRPQTVREWCVQLGRAGLDLETIRSAPEPAPEPTSESTSASRTMPVGVRPGGPQPTPASTAATAALSSGNLDVDATQVSPVSRTVAAVAETSDPAPAAPNTAPGVAHSGTGASVAKGAELPPRPRRALKVGLIGLSLMGLLGVGGTLWWLLTQEPGSVPSGEAGVSDRASTELVAEPSDAGRAPAGSAPEAAAPTTPTTPVPMPTTPTPVPAEVDAISLAQAVMSSLDCATLTDVRLTQAGSEQRLLLQGFVRDRGQLARLRQALHDRLPGMRIDTRDLAIAAPFCAMIMRLNQAMTGVPVHPDLPVIAFNHADRIYHQDDILALTAMQPGDAAGFLYLEFIDGDGNAASLLPNALRQSNFLSPGARLEVGAQNQDDCDRAPEGCFLAAEPHGNNLILAIWSARPLDADWYRAAPAADALSELAVRLGEQGRVPGGAVTLGYQFLTTTP